MKSPDLETLRDIFQDDRRWIAIGQILSLDLAQDKSVLRVKVSLLPEQRTVICDMSWSHCGAGSGFVAFPQPQDLVIVAFAEGNHEHGFVVARLSSKADLLPARATAGHLVAQANPGSHADLTSDTQANVVAPKINLGKTPTSPTEPLVLGNVLVSAFGALLDAVLNAAQIGQGATGPVMLDPSIRQAWIQWKSTYLTTASSNIISQLGFTERGGS